MIFSTSSTEQDGGYPGSLNVAMKLTLSPVSGELKIEYTGMTTKKTPIDISNNIMMNLAGHKSGNSFAILQKHTNAFQIINNFSHHDKHLFNVFFF